MMMSAAAAPKPGPPPKAAIPSAIVIGGTSFIGTAIVRFLQSRHPECTAIHIISLNPPAETRRIKGIAYHRLDISRDEKQLEKLVGQVRPALLVHAAEIKPGSTIRDQYRYLRVNIVGTVNVLKAAKDGGVEGLVYMSSSKVGQVFGTDQTAAEKKQRRKLREYVESKTAAEKIVLLANTPTLKTTVLRLCPVFGAEKNVQELLDAAYNVDETSVMKMTNSKQADWLHIDNCALAHCLVAENLLSITATAAGETFMVTNCNNCSRRTIWLALSRRPGTAINKADGANSVSLAIAEVTGAAITGIKDIVAKWRGKPPVLVSERVQNCSYHVDFDCSKAARVFGYVPVIGLDEGFRVAYEAYDNQITQEDAQELGAYRRWWKFSGHRPYGAGLGHKNGEDADDEGGIIV